MSLVPVELGYRGSEDDEHIQELITQAVDDGHPGSGGF